jgi:hypothetical protein
MNYDLGIKIERRDESILPISNGEGAAALCFPLFEA